MTGPGTLRDAFLEDHRKLTGGLQRLLDALEREDLDECRVAAATLDREVGAHMEFEERVFYPTLIPFLGKDQVDDLYHEHGEGQDAVRTLMERSSEAPLTNKERERLTDQVRTTLNHAISCGSLLSYVDKLDSVTRREMLGKLLQLRRQGPRWTALSARLHRQSV